MEGMIDITGADLREVARAVYEMSAPQGLGFLHYQEGGLDDEDIDSLLRDENNRIALSMDYVHGRACKFTVFREDGRLYIRNRWYDHTPAALEEFLKRIGVDV